MEVWEGGSSEEENREKSPFHPAWGLTRSHPSWSLTPSPLPVLRFPLCPPLFPSRAKSWEILPLPWDIYSNGTSPSILLETLRQEGWRLPS